MYAALAAIGPLVWTLVDLAVTGNPLFSLLYTSGSAEDLGRQRTLSQLPTAIPGFFNILVKLPIMIAATIGFGIALVMAPRRMVMPFVLLASGIGTFVLIGIAGASVIERYLAVAAVALLLFAAVFFAGFTMLRPSRAAHAVGGRLGGADRVRRRLHGDAGAAGLLRLRADVPRRRARRPRARARVARPCRRACAAGR